MDYFTFCYYGLFNKKKNKDGLLLKRSRYLQYQLQPMILQIHLLVSAPHKTRRNLVKVSEQEQELIWKTW